ncbi:unnamed protein product [Pleuronectes platessa]|uniref:Uncharacterized protein n=1 Tax=Pleuronectes platessa TaxID=8262 RepID=A0A9N7YTT2_PLEPL|nr:unnamed protein product [Pleuronectes platessa]
MSEPRGNRNSSSVQPPAASALPMKQLISEQIVFPVAIRSRQAEKIDSTPKRSLHGARQPRHNATLQPPVCSALRFNMGVDGSQRIGAALTPRFGDMDNSDEPEDLLDGKIVFQKNKDRTFSKTKVICTLCEKLSFRRSNTRLTTATRSMCWSARGVQVECAKPDSLAGHIVQKKRSALLSENLNKLVCLTNWLKTE